MTNKLMEASEKQRNGWSVERRRKQAEAIQKWQPWRKSTGPKSRRGKSNTARNAQKHGLRGQDWQDFLHLLARQRLFVRNVLQTLSE